MATKKEEKNSPLATKEVADAHVVDSRAQAQREDNNVKESIAEADKRQTVGIDFTDPEQRKKDQEQARKENEAAFNKGEK